MRVIDCAICMRKMTCEVYVSTLRPILKFWGIGVALMRITWANYSKRWCLVSNVGVTQHGDGELNTSDWLQYV